MPNPPEESLPLIAWAARHGGRVAVVDSAGTHNYRELLGASASIAGTLLGDRADLAEDRVCYLTRRSFSNPAVQWGIWRAGGMAVPLAESHPPAELAYVIDDADPVAIVVDRHCRERVEPLALERGIRLIAAEEAAAGEVRAELPTLTPERAALMIYTSGSTGRPKGVVTTHGNVTAQVETLVSAWEWSADDHIVLVLPLHHIHGVVNVLTCALWSGARCTMTESFDAAEVWEHLSDPSITLFMAVPTVYSRLISAWTEAPPDAQARWSEGARGLRLMVSGSAALPVSVLERWRELTGHTLLERYGMTEIGMGLSNPLHGARRPGHVGQPLPGVTIRRVDAAGRVLTDDAEPGELQVQGPSVFREYWRRPEATAEAFDGPWFRTGDVGIIEDGHYRLLGRNSVDILKSGGYKISALEIEEVLREHPHVRECAVVGLPDEEWGQRIACAVVPDGSARPSDPLWTELREHLRSRLAPYKLPREWMGLDALPRNAMGKVVKPDVSSLFEATGSDES